MGDLQIRVPNETHRLAALLALRYQQDRALLPDAIDEVCRQLERLAEEAERQELLDALISLGAVAVMLRKVGDQAAHDAVMDIILKQAPHFEELGERVIEAMSAFAERPV